MAHFRLSENADWLARWVSFPGWSDFAALLSHLKFVKNHQQHIAKVAAVTDSGFLSIMPSIASHFVHAQVRHFDYGDKQTKCLVVAAKSGMTK
ncbi:MAG: STAS/SEC14 domain-containing protein [Candidatus Methylumidiphilus sp.]